jgi:hypothetical protein
MQQILFYLVQALIPFSYLSDGTIHINTQYFRLLGKAPIMVTGMTLSTVKGGFVSAILCAGFHVEIAGGGHDDAAALRAKVTEIQSKIPPGVGITLNSLYINPRQFSFQLPLWQVMRKEGLPIEGFCVAAGIPSTDKAAEIIMIEELRNTLLSSPARWKGSDRSSASQRRIPTSPSFSSGPVDAPADTIRTRTSTNPFSLPTGQSDSIPTFPLLRVPGLVPLTMFGRTLRVSRVMMFSPRHSTGFCSRAESWLPKKHTRVRQ